LGDNKNTFSLPKFNFTHLDIFGQKEIIQFGDLCILKYNSKEISLIARD
jgi:hypothetical protein